MSEWIKCSDRLPEYNTEVLVTAEFDRPGDWRHSIGALDSNMRDSAAWKWWVKGASWTPTHWMPLPEPPAD